MNTPTNTERKSSKTSRGGVTALILLLIAAILAGLLGGGALVYNKFNSALYKDLTAPYEEAVANGYDGTMAQWLISFIEEHIDGEKSAYAIAVENGYTGTESQWLASLVGQDGLNGQDGKSAYDLAVENGFTGTLSQWLESLVGKDGVAGIDGKSAYDLALENGYTGTLTEWLVSLVGADGHPGKTAYELALESGYTGTLTEWLASLAGENGSDGKSAYEIAVENGYVGTERDWLASIVGATGKSAYELAKENGYTGTVSDWLLSLVGADGRNGKSAYEIAVENGYTGTESQWLASLVGAAGKEGKSAYELAQENGFEGTLAQWLTSLAGKDGADGQTGKSAYDLAVESGYGGTVTEWLASLMGKDGQNGKSAYELAQESGYTGTLAEWLASLAGENGEDGKSAYELAVENGYRGSESEWLDTLVGQNGKSAYELAQENGYTGTVSDWLLSLVGADGENGKSAYEVAVENGYTGTESQWLASLVGAAGKEGKSAYELAQENGYSGTLAQWLTSLNGQNGKSAYDLAVENGYQGTLAEWLVSLMGKDGEDGKSAYDLAVENGYQGTLAEWLATLAGEDGQDGEAGKSAYAIAVENGYAGTEREWLNSLVGTTGKSAYDLAVENGYQGTLAEWLVSLMGKDGRDGKSAYELAQQNGYTGTLAEWLASLAGENGQDGKDGQDGEDGQDGKSAFDLAVKNGYKGSESEWLASLVGATGKSAYELAQQNGYTGTVSDWLLSLVGTDGEDGRSAYEIAVENGYEGTESQWLASLVGKDGLNGQDGKSAYELARENGFEGTLDQWLSSLAGKDGVNGQDGKSAYAVAVENGYKGTEREWLDTLVGAAGTPGQSAYDLAKESGYTGTLTEWLASLAGENGRDGEDGKSAYEIAQSYGYQGSEEEWLESLVGRSGLNGEDGKSAYDLAVENGFEGTVTEWLSSLVGSTGKSAYDLAVENGFGGTLAEWLESLVGTDGRDGTDGKSAYEVAVENGYSGTISEWLASLVGEAGAAGKSAYDLAVENGYEGTLTEWLASLAGENGRDGEAGKSAYEIARDYGYQGTEEDWLASLVGVGGKSAYELAREAGFEGDVAAWLASLRGEDGKSAYELAKEAGYVGTLSTWLDSLVGQNGKSAYDLARENGFEGTLAEWLDSLVGEDGVSGANGKSAYEIAVENGYEGSVTEWLASLAGETGGDGKSAYEIAVGKGYQGTEDDWLASLKGDTGKSAYDLAVENGYGGTVTEWLESLAGENGKDGKSAYEIAVENGYKGSESEWLDTLVGQNGKSAYELAQENGYTGTVSDWLLSLVGTDGKNGKSAYEISIENGYEGTESQWLASLVGAAGKEGKSAYELAQENGFEGTLAQWLTSLAGKDGADGQTGKSAYDLAVENGYGGTVTEWLASLVGKDGQNGQNGKSAFDLAMENGYKGSESEWLASLIGAAGKDGKSAYEIAVDNGYEGNMTEWLASLVGAAGQDGQDGKDGKDGKSAYEIAKEHGYEGTEEEWIKSFTGGSGAAGQNGKSAYELAQENGYSGTLEEWLDSLVGKTGNGISQICLTESKGLVDTYTIYYTDGTEDSFTLTVAATWHTGSGLPRNISGARVGDLYLNLLNADVYELTAGGWVSISNIRGISITDVHVEALYDRKGKYFDRYTFTFSDGTQEVVDVYDEKKVYAIADEDYYAIVAEQPDRIPDIAIKIINANSSVKYVPLESYMIMNTHDVHFSTVGTYRVFIQYYGVCGYITLHILPHEPAPSDDSYINATDIIWSDSNFNSFTGSYLNILWDRPSIDPIRVPLTSQDVTVLKADGTEITDADRGKDLALKVTYKDQTFDLNVHWISDQNLKNVKVRSVQYIGEPLVLNPVDIAAEDVSYPDPMSCGCLAFELYTANCSGIYFRAIDMTVDQILTIDGDEPFSEGGYPGQITDYNMRVPLLPDVTKKVYDIDNTILIYVLEDGAQPTLTASLSKYDLLVTPYGVPDVTVTFFINSEQIVVPLTADMLVDPDFFKSEGIKNLELRYNYKGSELVAAVSSVFVHDLSRITTTSAKEQYFGGDTYYRYFRVEPVYSTMKCTDTSDTYPLIPVKISYIRGWDYWDLDLDNITLTHIYKTATICEEIIWLSQSDLLNLQYLDFSTPGTKEITFLVNGVEVTKKVDFYKVETGIIESITYNSGNYERDAIPTGIEIQDIGYLYLDITDWKLYDRYSGTWTQIADLSNYSEITEPLEIKDTEGTIFWIRYYEYSDQNKQIQYSYDGTGYGCLVDLDTYRGSSSSSPFFVGGTAPHDHVNQDDVMFYITHLEELQIGNVLLVNYYENVGHILQEELTVTADFFSNFDLSGFDGSYVGIQNITFRYGTNYTLNITVTVEPRNSRFVAYENVDGITNSDGKVLNLFVDSERHVVGSKTDSQSSINDYYCYYVDRELPDGTEQVYIANLQNALSFFSGDVTAETLRINYEYLYQYGMRKAIIDHKAKTIDIIDEVEYAPVDLSAIVGTEEVTASFRLDGIFGELLLKVDGESQILRFYYETYEDGTVISMDDPQILGGLQFYLVADDSSGELQYKAHLGKWGTKYTLDPTVMGGSEDEMPGFGVVLCDNGQLYLTYEGMSPEDFILLDYQVIDEDHILVTSQNILAKLDREKMTAEIVAGDTYLMDLTVVPNIKGDTAAITVGVDTMTMVLTTVNEGVETTQEFIFHYYEFAPNKFDVYLTEDNYVSTELKDQLDDYYLELADEVMTVKEDVQEVVYGIDYSQFYGFPEDLDPSTISTAQLKITTENSMMSIIINGQALYTGKYVYDPIIDAIYPAGFFDNEGTQFSFRPVDGTTVQMLDLLPGETYQVDMDAYLSLSDEDIQVVRSFARLNQRGQLLFYAELSVYDSKSGQYETELWTEVLRYRWTSDSKLVLLELDEDEELQFHLQLTPEGSLKLKLGNTDAEDMFFLPDGTGILFYRSGVAYADSSSEILSLYFYEYLDEDTVLITTILGVGAIYDIRDGILYLNEDYPAEHPDYECIMDSRINTIGLIVYRHKTTNKLLIKYEGTQPGNGEEITGGYVTGHCIDDQLSYSSFLLFTDLLMYNIDGQNILFIPGLD